MRGAALWCARLGCAGLVLGLGVGRATAQSFVKLADTSTPAGDGSDLRILSTPQIGGATALFIGESLNGLVGLYATPVGGGALVKLVDTNTPVPHGSGNFTIGRIDYFTPFQPGNCAAPVVGAKSAVFVGLDAAGNEGLYSVPLIGGRITVLANYNTPIPGGPLPDGTAKFNSQYSFCHVAVSGSTVVFDAGTNSGIYSVLTNGKQLARTADANTPIQAPEPFPVVNGFGLPFILKGQATYMGATTGGPFAILLGNTTSPGEFVISSASSEATDFDQFGYPKLGRSSILFSALENGTNNVLGLVQTDGTRFKVLFDTATSHVPKGALGGEFNQLGTDAVDFSGNDGYRQVFSAITNDKSPKPYAAYDGVYSSCKGKLTKILETGDAVGPVDIRATNGISLLQRETVGGKAVDQFAAKVTVGPPGSPTVYNGSDAIYAVNVPGC